VPEYTLTLLIWDTKCETKGYGLSSLHLWGALNLTPLGTVGFFPGNSSYDLPQSSSCLKNMSSLEDASLRYIMYIPWRWRQQAPPTCQHCMYTPLHKNDDMCELSNYRPIIFKNIWNSNAERILKYLTNYNTLSTEQYGFRLGLRTDNATYKLTTEILNAMNNKLLVGGIFLWFRESIWLC